MSHLRLSADQLAAHKKRIGFKANRIETDKLRKARNADLKTRAKYRNVKVVVDGIKFDSKKEAKRYGELRILEKAGKINGLQCQHVFSCIVHDKLICKYIVDFAYWKVGYGYVYEDVKSPITRKNPVYRIKKKLTEAIYGIQITEV